MTDKEALEYINYLEKYEGVGNNDPTFDSYAQFAATIAKDWYAENKGALNISLGECITAANTGLVIAARLYKKNNRTEQFRFYSKPVILAELDRLKN